MKKIENMKITAKRWFQRTYGNTYHTVKIFVNDEVLGSEITYGYGNHHLQTAADLLRAYGYEIPVDNNEAYALMCKYEHSAQDVRRKKDL